MPKYLTRAARALGIDVPIYRATMDAEGVCTLYLYGGRVVRWRPTPETVPGARVAGDAVKVKGAAREAPDDFTVIPQVGAVTARALHAAGLRTFADLRRAGDAELRAIDHVTSLTLRAIRAYLAPALPKGDR